MGLLECLLKSVGRFPVFAVVCGLVSSIMKYHNLLGGGFCVQAALAGFQSLFI